MKNIILVSNPKVDLQIANESVIWIVSTKSGYSLGLSLNKRSSVTFEKAFKINKQDRIYAGGPYSESLLLAHKNQDLDISLQLGANLFLTGKVTPEILNEDEQFRLFAGSWGWKYDDLIQEIQAGDWLTTPFSEEYLWYEEPCDLHKVLLNKIR